MQVKKLEAKLYQASDPSDLLGRHTRLKAKVNESRLWIIEDVSALPVSCRDLECLNTNTHLVC